MSSDSTISVCLLVRDYQHFLEPWFNAVRKWATQIVVVDAGSRPETSEFIMEHLEPQDVLIPAEADTPERIGFAACRNWMTSAASCTWVHHLDADESLPEEQIPKIGSYLAGVVDPLVLSRTLTFELLPNVDPADWETISRTAPILRQEWHGRIYRRDSQLTFRGYLHEGLFLGDECAIWLAEQSELVHYHFASYRKPDEVARTHRLYARMLLRAERETTLQDGMNPVWFSEYIPGNRKHLKELAEQAED